MLFSYCWGTIKSVSFTWHLRLVLVIIPSHSFPTREASQFSTLVTAVLAKCPTQTPAQSSPHQSWVYFFVEMMIESAEFLSVFIAVIRSDVYTVPVTVQSMTHHNTVLYSIQYIYNVLLHTRRVNVSMLMDNSLQKSKWKSLEVYLEVWVDCVDNFYIYIAKDTFLRKKPLK